MNSIKKIYPLIVDKENIRNAFMSASKGKRKRNDVKRVLENLDYHVEKVYTMLMNTAPCDIDVENRSLEYAPQQRTKHVINESTSKKIRVIDKPHFAYDQVIHHAIMQVLSPMIMKSMYHLCCGSVPKKGSNLGKKVIEKWIKTDRKNTKYILKMDIKHFYPSVNHEYLLKYLGKRIRDRRTVHLLGVIIRSCDSGLPLGFYTSQWLANYMLEPLDHYIKEILHAKYYVRYLDDMVIFGANKKELHKMRQEIGLYINGMNLRLKQNYQVFRFDYVSRKDSKRKGSPLDFMGFKFHRDKTTLRRSIMLSVTRKAKRISKKQKKTWFDSTGMLSYMGWISNTDTYHVYETRVKPFVNVQRLKRIIGSHQRKENKKYDTMEKG